MTMVLVKKRDNAGRYDLYNDINDCEMQEEENSHHREEIVKTLTFCFSYSSLCNFPLPPRAALRGLCKTRLLKCRYLFGFS